MASTTTTRLINGAGLLPARGTYPANANTLYPKGTIVTMDTDGRAVSPASADTSGLAAVGVANHTFDNRTGNPAGNGALDDSIDVEVLCGVFGFDYTGTPFPGDPVFVVDNQTVSDDATGPRGFAGFCTEVRDGLCYVWMGPHVLATADEIDLTTAEAAIDALEDDATFGEREIPLHGARAYVAGTIAPAWVDGVSDGFNTVAEGFGLKWNVASTTVFAVEIPMPRDIAPGSAITLHFLGYRDGASDVTAVLTCTAFFRVPGAAFSADVNCGGNTTAFDGATTVVTEETLTIAAGDVPEAAPASLLLTMVPSAALDADDLTLLSLRMTYTRAQQAT